MKKLLKNLLLIMIIAVIAMNFVGCELFDIPNPDGLGGNGNGGGEVVDFAKDVYFGSQQETDREYGLKPSLEKVDRSVVAIEIKANGATYYGSGVIVDMYSKNKQTDQIVEDDDVFYIITCHHVISSGGQIKVYVPDLNGRNYTDEDYNDAFIFSGTIGNGVFDGEVSLIGGDKNNDIAILKMDVSGRANLSKNDIVEAKVPADGYNLEKGDEVFAIGNPTGALPGALTRGIIAYPDREALFDSAGYMHVTQINVDIYHGSSGGGLFNYYGELVGITNGGSDTNSGINYAIPYKRLVLPTGQTDTGFIETAKKLLASYTGENYGFVPGRWNFGITVDTSNETRLSVKEVIPDSNAYLAGVEVGDVIKSLTYTINSKQKTENVTSSSSFSVIVAELNKYFSKGDSFTLTVDRGITLNLTFRIQKQLIFCDTGK